MSTDDNIRILPGAGGLPENPLRPAARRDGWCSHVNLIVDAHTRTIVCADPKCAAVIDPFDYLHSQAQQLQRAWSSHREVSRQASEIADRVHALKKEEQRLRSMVKRLQEKSGAVVSTRGQP